MLRRSLLAVGVVLIGVAAVAAGASARDQAQRPNLAPLVLRQSDVPGSTVIRQGYVKYPDYLATYERELEGGRFQALRLANVESDLSVAKTLVDAKLEITALQAMLTGTGGRRAFEEMMKQALAEETGPTGEVLSVRALRARKVQLGEGGVELAFVVRTKGGALGQLSKPMQFSMTEFRVDRLLGTLLLMSQPGHTLPPGAVTELGKVFLGRMTTGWTTGV